MTPTLAPALAPASPAPEKTAARTPLSIPSLDGLRALSFLVVFLAHASPKRWIPGDLGLVVFFFLSGYLITTLLRLECDQTGGISFRDFYLRRVLRIFPPFYLVLALAYGLTWTHALDNPPTWGAMAAQLGHFTNYYIVRHGWWTGIAPGTWVYWSLAVEEHFYLIFPLVYLFMRRRGLTGRQQMTVLLSLCGLTLLWRCVLVFGLHAGHERLYVATDTRVDSILFGCALAVYGNPALPDAPVFSERRLKTFWLPLALVTLLASFAVRAFWFQHTVSFTLQGLALAPIFMAAIRFPVWGAFRWLNARPVRFVGLLSYSLYLVHTTVLYGMSHWTRWPTALSAAASLAVCLLLSTGIYYGIERPAARLRKRLAHALAPKPRSGPPGGNAADAAVPPVTASPAHQKVARNVATTLATQLLSWGLTFVVTLYLPRYIGDVGLGAVTLAGSFAVVMSLLVSLGTSTVLVKDIARDHARTGEWVLAALALRVPLGLFAIALGWGVSHLLGYDAHLRLLIWVALGVMMVAQIGDVLASALRGLEEIPRQNAAALAEKVTTGVLTIALVVARAPLWTIVAAAGAGVFVALGMNAFGLRGHLGRVTLPARETMVSLTRAGLPFLTTAVFVSVYGQADALLLSKMSTVAAIGWYGLAKRLGGTTMVIPVALTGAMLPTLARLFHEDERAFQAAVRRLFNLMLVSVVPFAVLLVLAPARILSLLHYPASFAPSIPVLMLMGGAVVLWFLSQVAGTALIASDRQGVVSRVAGVAALVSVPLCAACIYLTQHGWHNGAIGAMLSDVLLEVYMVAAYVRALPPGLLTWGSAGVLGRATLGALPLVALFLLAQGRWGVLLLVPGLLVYVPLCAVLGCLHPSDMQMARQMLARFTARQAAA